VPIDDVWDCWVVRDGPTAKAFRYLYDLNLGPELSGPGSVGGIEFIAGPVPLDP
jgi:hypothetical protein